MPIPALEALHSVALFEEGQKRFALGKKLLAISLFCSQKTSDSHKKPKSKFTTQYKGQTLWQNKLNLCCLFTLRLWAISSCHFLQKSDCEQNPLCSLQKSDKSESLFNKEWREWLVFFFRANFSLAIKKEQFAQKSVLFSPCFWQFFTAFPSFYAQELIAHDALHSVDLF